MRIVICDKDMEQATDGKNRLLACAEKYGVEITVDIVTSGEQLLFYKDTKYADVDLIYTIYHLPKINGMDMAVALRKRGYIGDIIFCTHDPVHAREGYSVGALAYLLIDKETDETHETFFLKAVKNYQKRKEEIMSLSYHGERVNLPIDDIIYFEVLNHTVTVHYYKDGVEKTFECYSGLTKIAQQLSGKGFLRAHKSYLVSMKHIYKRTPDSLEMTNGDIIPIGKSVR